MNSSIKKIASIINNDLHNYSLKSKSNRSLAANKDQIKLINKYLKSLRRRITLPNSSNLSN